MHRSAIVSFARNWPDIASSCVLQPCKLVAAEIILEATHSHVKLANPACVAVHASQYTDTLNVVAMTLSASCPQVDDADALISDEQAVEGVVRRRGKVNSRAKGRAAASRAGEDLAAPVAGTRGRNAGQGRTVAVTMEGREPWMGLVRISTAWQMDLGICNISLFIA